MQNPTSWTGDVNIAVLFILNILILCLLSEQAKKSEVLFFKQPETSFPVNPSLSQESVWMLYNQDTFTLNPCL